jgi:hypothetical protein
MKIQTSKKNKKLSPHKEYVIEIEHQNDRKNTLTRRMRIHTLNNKHTNEQTLCPCFLRFRHLKKKHKWANKQKPLFLEVHT